MQATSGKYVELFTGDSKALNVIVVDDNGNAIDLTNASVTWQLAVKNWKSDPAAVPIITKSSATAGQITLASGSFTVNIVSADTAGLTEGNYYQEAQVTLSDGTIGTPLTGTVKIKPNLIAPY
jgi:hypothetical protein